MLNLFAKRKKKTIKIFLLNRYKTCFELFCNGKKQNDQINIFIAGNLKIEISAGIFELVNFKVDVLKTCTIVTPTWSKTHLNVNLM